MTKFNIRGVTMLDIAIIGAGPAGLSAAINGVIRNKKVTVFGRNPQSSYLYKAEKVDNYLGMPNITGPEMVEQFEKHARDMGVHIHEGRVLEVFCMGEYYTLNVDNEFIEARTVIIATGIPKAKYIKGEKEYIGRGVSYCATCDGPLYRDKVVAVVGETPEAEEDVNYLQEICSKVLYVPIYKEIPYIHGDVEKIQGRVTEIFGEDTVKGMTVGDQKYLVEGIFLIKEIIPATQLIHGLELDDKVIKVNRYMETNLPGVYGAGDCTGRPLQISKAVSEGLIAAQQAVRYLHEKDTATAKESVS
jgi:thioredoxin reductase (NADPH)